MTSLPENTQLVSPNRAIYLFLFSMEQKPQTQQSSSHWGEGAALALGLAAGLAAGLFLRSKKGKELTNDVKKTAASVQKQLAKKLKAIPHLTKEKYETIVDELVGAYQKTAEMAEGELKTLKAYLLGQWEDVQTKGDKR